MSCEEELEWLKDDLKVCRKMLKRFILENSDLRKQIGHMQNLSQSTQSFSISILPFALLLGAFLLARWACQ